jgi:signal peptidase I
MGVVFLSLVYGYGLVALAGWGMVGWGVLRLDPVVAVSDSMAPSIDRGDVVFIGPLPEHGAAPGSVLAYADPTGGARLLTHRVVEVLPDGSYRTRGDANAVDDGWTVAPEQVVGAGRLVVPKLGLVVAWTSAGQWWHVAGWLAVSMLAVLGGAARMPVRLPVRSGDDGAFDDIGPADFPAELPDDFQSVDVVEAAGEVCIYGVRAPAAVPERLSASV